MWFRKKPVAKARTRSEFLAEMEKLHRERPVNDIRRAEVSTGGQSTPVSPTQPNFEGNPEHLSKLKEGVEAWNKWREENPDIRPDLRGADFTRAEDFQGTPIWGCTARYSHHRECALLDCANFCRANLANAIFTGALIASANLKYAIIQYADFSDADLLFADLSHAHCTAANFRRAYCDSMNVSGAYLGAANFNGAILAGASFKDAQLHFSDLSGAYLGLVDLSDANVTGITYNRRRLRNRCHGIRAEACYGNAQFKRDVMDQDYVDQIEDRIRNVAGYKPNTQLKKLKWWAVALLNGFIQGRALLLGVLIGLVVSALVLHHAADGAHRLANFGGTFGIAQSLRIAGVIILASVAFAGFFAGTIGKLAIFKLWGLFDYGRSWAAVLVFAAVMILLFGSGYYAWDGVHLDLIGEKAGHVVWFFPWFVALMGFATLGISSYATPLDRVGALLMMANVLSGFLTLGLLLSVLGNIFARRA